jgi:hypothetical protein
MAGAGDRHRAGIGTAVERPRPAGSEEFWVKRPAEQLEDQFTSLGSQ